MSAKVGSFGSSVDFGRTAADYGKHRAGFPPAFFERLATREIARPGERALDIGTGTGTIALGLAELGLAVTGVDPSPTMLGVATERAREAGAAISFKAGRVEQLPEPDASYDLVTAGQCWHWFDRPKAAAEIARVLKPGGRVVLAYFDWLPLPGNVVEATEDLIGKHNPDWALAGGTGMYPRYTTDLAIAGYGSIETFSFDVDQPYSHAAWRGRVRASAGVGAILSQGAVERFDAAHAILLAQRFRDEPLLVPHRVWAVIGTKP